MAVLARDARPERRHLLTPVAGPLVKARGQLWRPGCGLTAAAQTCWKLEMEFSALLIFAAALAVNASSPGPSVAALVARVLSRGHRSVWPFLIAMWIGEATWLALAAWGVSAIAQSFHLAFLAIKWMGAAYLLFLAWKIWNAPAALESGVPERRSSGKMFAAGLAITLGNPKIMIFYMALLPAMIDVDHISLPGWAELTATMLAVLIAVDCAWVTMAAKARLLLRSPRAIRAVNRCSAGMMAGAATAIAAR
jgi:threonine/homoserine/homoserine lactone efflux protein